MQPIALKQSFEAVKQKYIIMVLMINSGLQVNDLGFFAGYSVLS